MLLHSWTRAVYFAYGTTCVINVGFRQPIITKGGYITIDVPGSRELSRGGSTLPKGSHLLDEVVSIRCHPIKISCEG